MHYDHEMQEVVGIQDCLDGERNIVSRKSEHGQSITHKIKHVSKRQRNRQALSNNIQDIYHNSIASPQ